MNFQSPDGKLWSLTIFLYNTMSKSICFRHSYVQKEPHSGHQKGTYVYNNICSFVLTKQITFLSKKLPSLQKIIFSTLQKIYGSTFHGPKSVHMFHKILGTVNFSSPLCSELRISYQEKIGASS